MPTLRDLSTTRRLYCFIRQYMRTAQSAPTFREMAEACFISTGSVMLHLDRLEMLGYIEREPNRSRGIRLTTRPGFDCDGVV